MNLEFFKSNANKIFNTNSPSGYTCEIVKVIGDILDNLGFNYEVTKKGNVLVRIKGLDCSKKICTSAHTDTLGLMVRSINSDGTLNVTNVGGILVPTIDGEYCTIMTRDSKKYSGTIISKSPSVHVYPDAKNLPRDIDNVIVRIDEVVKTKEDVLNLGISNGDYIFIDPKMIITESGFLKSRFIDDKGSVCAILSVLKKMVDLNIKPKYDTIIYFVNQEEVGHGAASIERDIDEFVTVDMGCVGLDLAGNEYAVSIAAKDSGGPYDYELTTRLINLAKENNIKYVVDIFPMYGSDIGAAYHSGVDFKGALIGPGVCASHGMERTHIDAIRNTVELLFLYLTR